MARGNSSRASSERLRSALDAIDEAFDQGDLEKVLELCRGVLSEDPGSVEALHYQAAAHVELGHFEEAEGAYGRALKIAPDNLDLILGAADLFVCHPGEDRELIERGLALCARGRKLAQREEDVEMEYELLLVEG